MILDPEESILKMGAPLIQILPDNSVILVRLMKEDRNTRYRLDRKVNLKMYARFYLICNLQDRCLWRVRET